MRNDHPKRGFGVECCRPRHEPDEEECPGFTTCVKREKGFDREQTGPTENNVIQEMLDNQSGWLLGSPGKQPQQPLAAQVRYIESTLQPSEAALERAMTQADSVEDWLGRLGTEYTESTDKEDTPDSRLPPFVPSPMVSGSKFASPPKPARSFPLPRHLNMDAETMECAEENLQEYSPACGSSNTSPEKPNEAALERATYLADQQVETLEDLLGTIDCAPDSVRKPPPLGTPSLGDGQARESRGPSLDDSNNSPVRSMPDGCPKPNESALQRATDSAVGEFDFVDDPHDEVQALPPGLPRGPAVVPPQAYSAGPMHYFTPENLVSPRARSARQEPSVPERTPERREQECVTM
jgi:hypothetical protein